MRAATLTRTLIWLSALAIGLPAAAHACPASPEDMVAHAEEAEAAFSSMNLMKFEMAHQAVLADVSCLGMAPSPRQAALVHRVEALASFLAQDPALTKLALRAMIEADSTTTLPGTLAPEDGELRALYAAALALPASSRLELEVPAGFALIVDGKADSTRPTERSSLVVITADSRTTWSGLLAGADELPPLGWSIGGSGIPASNPVARRPPRGGPLLIAAGGTALAAGGLWAATLSGRARINEIREGILANRTEDELSITAEEVEALRVRTGALGYAAQGATGLAIGLGVVGVVVRW